MHPDPWPSPNRPEVALVALSHATIGALAQGDLAAAQVHAPVLLTDELTRRDARRTWAYRARQLTTAPADAPWITRAIVDSSLGHTAGMAGFHGQPDERGMVEVGYRVGEEYRRRGYARAALEALLDVARKAPDVHVFRATISPDNEASRNLVLQYGLVEVGEQWDDEDGLEVIFEAVL